MGTPQFDSARNTVYLEIVTYRETAIAYIGSRFYGSTLEPWEQLMAGTYRLMLTEKLRVRTIVQLCKFRITQVYSFINKV